MLWIGCGQQDSLFSRSKNLSDLLTKHESNTSSAPATASTTTPSGGSTCRSICRCCFASLLRELRRRESHRRTRQRDAMDLD